MKILFSITLITIGTWTHSIAQKTFIGFDLIPRVIEFQDLKIQNAEFFIQQRPELSFSAYAERLTKRNWIFTGSYSFMRLNYDLYYLTPVDQIPVRVKIFNERSSQFGLSFGKIINIPNSGFSLTPIIGLRLVRNHSLRWPTNDIPDRNRIFEYHKSENDTMYMWGFVYSYEKIYPLQSTGIKVSYTKKEIWSINLSCFYNHGFYPIIETEYLIYNEDRVNEVFYESLYNNGSFVSFQFGLSYSLSNLLVENPKN